METKTLMKWLLGTVCMFPAFAVVGCDSSDILNFSTSIEQISDLGGGGQFYVINASTKDTVKTGGSLIGTTYPTLNAKTGELLKLNFIPKTEYSQYTFNVTYILHDSTEISSTGKEYGYEYTPTDVGKGKYTIEMSAGSTKQVITASGKVVLNVTE